MAHSDPDLPLPSTWVVGLGGNLGDVVAAFEQALLGLAELGEVLAISKLYSGVAIGGPPGQPDYFNAAVLLRTPSAPKELLARTLGLESLAGRTRQERWGPRTLDLDLLYWESGCVDLPELQVPHPRLAERAFALRPLLDVLPSARDPHTGVELRLTLEHLPHEPLAVVGEPDDARMRWRPPPSDA